MAELGGGGGGGGDDLTTPLKVSTLNNVRVYNCAAGKTLPEWATEFDCNSWAQFSLKYVLSHPAVTCVLTETANPKHVVDNLGGGVGRLPDQATRAKMRDLIQSFV